MSPADEGGAVQDVSIYPAGERSTQDHDQSSVGGEILIPRGFQLAQDNWVLPAEPIDLIEDDYPFASRVRSASAHSKVFRSSARDGGTLSSRGELQCEVLPLIGLGD